MSIEAMIKCDRCEDRLLVSSAQVARVEAAAKGWAVAGPGKRPGKKDFCKGCVRWIRAEAESA